MLNSGVFDSSITGVLEDVCQTSGLEGLAVLDLSQEDSQYVLTYSAGAGGSNTVAVGHMLLATNTTRPSHTIASDKRPIIACPWRLSPAQSGGLVLWRGPHGRRWTETDHGLVASLAVVLRASIGAETSQIGIDRLTGMPNRRWFIDETDRHIDRLDLDGHGGTLFLVDIDDMSRLNVTLGRRVGDSVLVRLGQHLRATIRPGDVLGRVGGDELAIWQNGMDYLTAAERAETLCSSGLFDDLTGGHRVTVSIGIATRQFSGVEDVRALLRRAHMASREAKSQGGSAWRVSHATTAGPDTSRDK